MNRDSGHPYAVALIALTAAALCFFDVSWALRPGLFPYLDELTNPTRFLNVPISQALHLFPVFVYNDRPVGFAFIGVLAHFFGFRYTPQVLFLIGVHFANCVLALLLFRRLGARWPLALAGVALFGSLATTASTATYLGAAFDVLCLFFLLASTLALLGGRTVLSALLFLAALRSKEFAIVAPFALTILAGFRKLWLHYAIVGIFGLRYLFLLPHYHTAPGNPYAMDLHLSTLWNSLAYYASLAFGMETQAWFGPALLAAMAVLLVWAVVRRNAGVMFGVSTFLLLLQPISWMPHMRSPLYVYAPQLFLILALVLLADRVTDKHRIAGIGVALAALCWCAYFERSSYFTDRSSWVVDVRRASARTARELDAQIPRMPAGTHLYVAHAADATPWLFAAGPCSYPQRVNADPAITCVMDAPPDQLRAAYAADPGPKHFLDYSADGSVAVKD